MKHLILICIGGWLSLGLVASAVTQDYYPTEVGNRWVLRSTDQLDTRVIEITSEELLAGRTVNRLERRTNDNPADRLYVTTEGDGIHLHRSEVTVADLDLSFDYNPPQVFLPFPLELGTTWTVKGETSFLGTIISTSNRGTVVAIEDLTVPIGVFQNTFKIQQDVTLRLPIGLVKLQSFMWLARDIGVVREIDTTDVTYELIEYDLVPNGSVAVEPETSTPLCWAVLKMGTE